MTLGRAFAIVFLALIAGPKARGAAAAQVGSSAAWTVHQAANPNPSAAYRWLETILEATARDVDRVGARPTIISRQVAIPVTAMYDAWAAYDDKAVGTRLLGRLRRPAAERTLANRQKAISYAVYRTLVDQFPADAKWIDEQMRQAGHDPGDVSTDPTTAQGVGNTVAAALLAYRRHDGANQYGDEVGSNGEPYSDYTFYRPQRLPGETPDPGSWMPIPFSNGKGGTFSPGFLTPHWYRVTPFALDRSDQFRPPPPPAGNSEQLRRETEECVRMNANLTLEQKAIVEFMRDGPRSTGQSGHWLRFAQDVSRRDKYDLDRDVKLFFSVANVAFDAFIAAWESKRYFDTSRPYWYVRHFYRGLKLEGYAGPGKGFALLDAEDWSPYSPATFVTPPFPGYVSGHSTVSGAGSRMLELFTGSDRYEAVERRSAGAMTEPGFTPAQMQARNGVPTKDAPPTTLIELKLPTFTAVAEMAGISRVLGGYHIQADNQAGLALGRQVAAHSWPRYQAYFNGTASLVK
jgi:hypothetical protein